MENDNLHSFYNPNNLKRPVDSIPDNELNISEQLIPGKPIIFTRLHVYSFETGYQIYYQEINYNYTNNYTANQPFQYSEVRNAGYAGAAYNYKKFGFQANVRAEYSSIDINNSSSTWYICFLPSVNLQYKYSGAQSFKLTYNRRIVRPGISDLYPFRIGSGFGFELG